MARNLFLVFFVFFFLFFVFFFLFYLFLKEAVSALFSFSRHFFALNPLSPPPQRIVGSRCKPLDIINWYPPCS